MSQDYTAAFYDEIEQGSYRSAQAVLSLLYRLYKPRSVIDVGCGRGGWLAAAEQLGSTELVGLDGDWVEQTELMSPSITYRQANLENSLPLDRRFGLCLCLEVAEHLSPGHAKSFISGLCALSDVIVFSAAIPAQGGVNHVNEQWQSHWISSFSSYGFLCFDLFRPVLWDTDDVEWWYRQNVFLFVLEETELACSLNEMNAGVVIPDIIHPLNQANKQYWNRKRIEELEKKVKAADSSNECLPLIARYFAGSHPELASFILELVRSSDKKGVK